MSKLDDILRQAARRHMYNKALRLGGIGITIGAIASLALLALDRLDVVGLPVWIYPVVCAVGLIIGAGAAMLRQPDALAVAARLDDALRLRDRLGSAVAVQQGLVKTPRDQQKAFARWTVHDAQQYAQNIPLRRAVPIRFTSIWNLSIGLCIALVLGVFFLPRASWGDSPQQIARHQEEAAQLEQQRDALRQTIQDTVDDFELDAVDDERLAQQLEALRDLEQQLAAAPPTPETIAESRDESAARFNEIAERLEQQAERDRLAMEELARDFESLESVEAPPTTEQLIEQLRQGNLNNVADELERLLNQSQELNEPQRRDAAQSLRSTSNALQQDKTEDVSSEQQDEQLEQVLRDQGLDEQAIDEVTNPDEAPTERELADELMSRGVDEQLARDVAEQVHNRNQQQAAEQQAQEDRDLLREALNDAADELDPPSPQEKKQEQQDQLDSDTSAPEQSQPNKTPPTDRPSDDSVTDSPQPDADDTNAEQPQPQQQQPQPAGQESAPQNSEQSPREQPSSESKPPQDGSDAKQSPSDDSQNNAQKNAKENAGESQSSQQSQDQQQTPNGESQKTTPQQTSQEDNKEGDKESDEGHTQQPAPQQNDSAQKPAPSKEDGEAQQTPGQQPKQQPTQQPGKQPDGEQTPAAKPSNDPNDQSAAQPQPQQDQTSEQGSPPQQSPDDSSQQNQPQQNAADDTTVQPTDKPQKDGKQKPVPKQSTDPNDQKAAQPKSDRSQAPKSSDAGDRQPSDDQTAPESPQQPQPQPQQRKSPAEKIRELQKRRDAAERWRNASDETKQRAREMAENMSDEQKQRWARELQKQFGDQPSSGDQLTDDNNPQSDGSASENTESKTELPSSYTPNSTETVDARGDEQVADQIISEWLSDQPSTGQPGKTGEARSANSTEPVRRAQDFARRAVNQSTVPRRYHRLIDRYFGRLPKAVEDAGAKNP